MIAAVTASEARDRRLAAVIAADRAVAESEADVREARTAVEMSSGHKAKQLARRRLRETERALRLAMDRRRVVFDPPLAAALGRARRGFQSGTGSSPSLTPRRCAASESSAATGY